MEPGVREPVIERIAGPGVQVIDPAPAVARQAQRLLEDRAVDTGNLDVHLQGCDAVHRAGDLEVHIAKEILQALDVGKNGQFSAFLICDQSHRDARNRCVDRNAGIHQAQGGTADGSH